MSRSSWPAECGQVLSPRPVKNDQIFLVVFYSDMMVVMTKIPSRITKVYLNRAESVINLKNISDARKKFDNASQSRVKLRIKSVKDDVTSEGTKIRIYKNSTGDTKPPIIVYFHGGGFVLGSIDSHDSVCRYLAKYSRCIVVSVEYSRAPESMYPEPIREGISVLEWVQAKAEQIGGTGSNIYLAGDSAGGTIALGISRSSGIGQIINGLILIYPAIDPSLASESMQKYAKGYFLTKSMLAEFWSMFIGGDNQYRPPTDEELKDLPPTLVIGAEKDVLVDEGRRLVTRMENLGLNVEYECYADMLHGFVQFPKIVSSKIKAFKRIAKFIENNSN